MEYIYEDIGNRLKEERKAAGYKSHDSLAEYLANNNYRTYKRQTIAKWEKGEECPPLDVLLTLCKLYKCELGYLLCEYDCKTKENTDIQQATGLSEDAILALQRYNRRRNSRIEIISRLLTSNEFEYKVIKGIADYKNSLDRSIELLNQIDIEMADFHTDYENYSKEDEERYFKICDLEKKLLKEIDTSQPLALWEVQKHFTSVIESMYHQELEEIQTRYRKYQP